MSTPPSADPDRHPLDVLAEEFADRYRRGEHPSVGDYVRQHPQWSQQLRELLPPIALMERLKLRNGGLVAVEHRRRTEPFQTELRRLARIRRADYGEVSLTFFTKAENA